jgi:hypothetical protein
MGSALSNQTSQNVLALAALIILLVALFTTILQALQQYFSSANGYRKCAESVMGLWAKRTHRKLRLREFRIEVVYETPVIFPAHPNNKDSPLHGKEIHYIDGTEYSCRNTCVFRPITQKKIEVEAVVLYTIDDERAS